MELRRRERILDDLRARRAGNGRVLKRLEPATLALLERAIQLQPGMGGEPLPAGLVSMLTQRISPPSWNRYANALRGWGPYVEAHGLPFLPASGPHFASFLAEAGELDEGYSQTKLRVCCIDALSTIAGVASPAKHPLVDGYREGARRVKTARRGRATPIFPAEIPTILSPKARPTGRHGRARLRRHQATAAHMALMSAGAIRYDDAQEGRLGDAVFFPDVSQLVTFGSKTDATRSGQLAVLAAPGGAVTGQAALFSSVRRGLTGLLEMAPGDRAAVISRFRGRQPAQRAVGQEAMATWPADIQALARPLYEQGLAVHDLPLFGKWLMDLPSERLDLSAPVSLQRFCNNAKAVLAGAGKDTRGVGGHSMRRGAAVALIHTQASREVVATALRHSNPRSVEPYILTSATAAATARAVCALSSPAGPTSAGGAPVPLRHPGARRHHGDRAGAGGGRAPQSGRGAPAP